MRRRDENPRLHTDPRIIRTILDHRERTAAATQSSSRRQLNLNPTSTSFEYRPRWETNAYLSFSIKDRVEDVYRVGQW